MSRNYHDNQQDAYQDEDDLPWADISFSRAEEQPDYDDWDFADYSPSTLHVVTPPTAGRRLLEVKGTTEGATERIRREAVAHLDHAIAWSKQTATEMYSKGSALAREARGLVSLAQPPPKPIDWEKELFLPEERERIREWRAQGLRPPLDWDAEIGERVSEYVAEVSCRAQKDMLTACYSRNYTHLTARRCGNRLRWFKQCVRSSVQQVLPDWGDLTPAPTLEPDLADDFAPQNMRWPKPPPPTYYVFPSAAYREELWDAVGSFRMDAYDVNAWPVPFMHAFREELGVPDWFFDYPTAFAPSAGPIDGQTKIRDMYPNMHAETENWPNEYADEYTSPGMWVGGDPRAKGGWTHGLANTCDPRDPYCRSNLQVLRFRINPWRFIINFEDDPVYSIDQIASGRI